MGHLRNSPGLVWGITTLLAMALAITGPASAQEKAAASSGDSPIAKAVGTIKSVQANSITVAAESGGEVTATLAVSTKILRVPPGEKDLKNATALQPQDLEAGDRVLVRGHASTDPHTMAALAVIVMKQSDVSAQQQRERDDWQKRGVGGLVNKVDAGTGTIAISSGGFGASRSIAIHISKDTVLRRYTPGSVKFNDAKAAPLDQIKVGDQLRARGARTPDGSELAAEEIVSGSFRNIAGTITTIDATRNTMTVQDLIAKAPVVIKVSSDSQMKKLPAEMALRIAARLKGGAGANGDQATQGASAQNVLVQNGSAQGSPRPGGAQHAREGQSGRGPGGGADGNGPPDLQRLLSRLPNSTLTDLEKGETVMLVATQGGDAGVVTAITLFAGVEPMLTVAQSRSTYSLLSPWSLNTGSGEGESAP
jgi:hypothetical protein